MKNNTYQEKFNKAYKKMYEAHAQYIKDHGLEGKAINSEEHTEYFAIEAEWLYRRACLDNPILKGAYYEVGDEVSFVKRNTYRQKVKNHLLIVKTIKSFTVFDRDDPDLDVKNQKGSPLYYENVLSTGIISQIKTSDSGSGEIVYLFNELNPTCPESNPYVIEKDVITKII